ncbi:MAG: hypothetical protein ABIS14_02060 [Sphingomonas sp.]
MRTDQSSIWADAILGETGFRITLAFGGIIAVTMAILVLHLAGAK